LQHVNFGDPRNHFGAQRAPDGRAYTYDIRHKTEEPPAAARGGQAVPKKKSQRGSKPGHLGTPPIGALDEAQHKARRDAEEQATQERERIKAALAALPQETLVTRARALYPDLHEVQRSALPPAESLTAEYVINSPTLRSRLSQQLKQEPELWD
jgi:hypothetical protein